MTTVDSRPGLSNVRLAQLVQASVERCALDLSGAVVLTEAATGPYVVTPVLAALAGAEVIALTKPTRYGSVDEVRAVTQQLAAAVGVADRITVTTERSPELFARADVVTNSGHLRPIVGELASAIRPDAVLSLMFEAWEIQAGRLDIDLDLLRERGVAMAGTNERHPHVDVFSFLGPMAVAQLADAGVSAYLGRIALLCDNPFAEFMRDGLLRVGAQVELAADLPSLLFTAQPDALVVAMTPTGSSVLSAAQLRQVAQTWPGTVLTQYWGDIDRSLATDTGLACWPAQDPGAGHMGVLPSRVGPEPIVRLQTGGLKVAQVLLKPVEQRTESDLAYVDFLTVASSA
jgi:hypothetical protein